MEPLRDELTVQVRHEDDSFWATVDEYPGVFATGDTMDELWESVAEGLRVYLSEAGRTISEVQLGDPVPRESEPEIQTIRKTLVSA